jgi:hypothetical protein
VINPSFYFEVLGRCRCWPRSAAPHLSPAAAYGYFEDAAVLFDLAVKLLTSSCRIYCSGSRAGERLTAPDDQLGQGQESESASREARGTASVSRALTDARAEIIQLKAMIAKLKKELEQLEASGKKYWVASTRLDGQCRHATMR